MGLVLEHGFSEPVVRDSVEPTALGLVSDQKNNVGQKNHASKENPNPWWPSDEEDCAKRTEASSPHLSEFEDYLAEGEARKNAFAEARKKANCERQHANWVRQLQTVKESYRLPSSPL